MAILTRFSVHRWKHAALCHHDSILDGEGDYFEHDDIYNGLIAFEPPVA